jgi:peroxiredoxin
LEVISIDIPGDKDANIRRFLDTAKLPFPSGQDTTGAICKLYGVESTPTSVFITRDGRVVKAHVGAYATPEDFKRDITALLAS